MTSYTDFIQHLFSMRASKTAKYSLDNCLTLHRLIGLPDLSYACIHVAGTNGKGSVCTKLAASLQQMGMKTGLFTSPHISCYRERICVGNEKIPEQEALRLGTKVLHLAEQQGIATTFFEVTTLIALLYFQEQNVDWAILEVGLGGRLDATNVIQRPKATVITSISLDHTHILGSTIEQIAWDKGGIIKPGVPIIIGPRVPKNVIYPLAHAAGAPFFQVTERSGDTDQENALVASRTLEVLGFPLDAYAGALLKKPPCRFETIAENVILDVAHNVDGIQKLFEKLKREYPKKKLRVVCGFSKTKDAAECLAIIQHHTKQIHPVCGDEAYCLSTQDLAAIAQIPWKSNSCEQEIEEARSLAQANDELLVICGSFYIMHQARQLLY